MAKTVLIVEDNELNMKLFRDLLEAHGYQTSGTSNGFEALANAFTVASSRSTKSSTEARKCGSAAAVRSVSGPIPDSARNRPSRSGSPAMKESA